MLGLGWSASEKQMLDGYLIDDRGRKAFAEVRETNVTGEVFSVFAQEWDCQMLDSTKKGRVN